jgi:hypothetical protein
MKSITSPWRCQLVTCVNAVSKFVSRVNWSGVHCTDEVLAVGMMVIVLAATLAEPLTLAHHKFIAAVPFSWISIIGMRLLPGSGGESRNSALPNGNVASLAEAEISEAASRASTKQQAERQRNWSIVVPGKVSTSVRGGTRLGTRDKIKPQRAGLRQANWAPLVEIG